MRLDDYAAAMARSRKPEELSVARYIRQHHGELANFLRNAGKGLTKDNREELVQACVMAVVEAVRELARLSVPGEGQGIAMATRGAA